MDDLNFLTHAATEDSTASLIVLLPDNAVSHIHNVAPFAILEKCPLLYHTFEFGANAARQANIEASSLSAVSALLRYLYTGDYLPQDERGSLINHAEVFKIAVDFDLPPLQVQAYVNFSAGTEYACCFVTPPPELCQTIRFVYEHLASSQSRQEQSLLDTLLHYCISMLSYQGLYKHAEFRQVILDLPAFHKDLCRQSMQRNFEDDGAMELVRLPVSHTSPHPAAALHERALGDFQYELLRDLEGPYANSNDKPEPNSIKENQHDANDQPILVLRPKDPEQIPAVIEPTSVKSEDAFSSDDGDFTLVHRLKDNTTATATFEYPESEPSSADMVSIPGSPLEEEWEWC